LIRTGAKDLQWGNAGKLNLSGAGQVILRLEAPSHQQTEEKGDSHEPKIGASQRKENKFIGSMCGFIRFIDHFVGGRTKWGEESLHL
jgi:hypothetical protein